MHYLAFSGPATHVSGRLTPIFRAGGAAPSVLAQALDIYDNRSDSSPSAGPENVTTATTDATDTARILSSERAKGDQMTAPQAQQVGLAGLPNETRRSQQGLSVQVERETEVEGSYLVETFEPKKPWQ